MSAIKNYYHEEICAMEGHDDQPNPDEERWYQEMDSNAEWISQYEKALANNRPTNLEHDMKIGQMTESKYLKKDDVEPAIKLTIASLTSENLAMDDKAPEMKWVLHFTTGKPMVVNTTNSQLIALALGSEETDDWVGKEIVLFNDPTVSFAGKLTGGIRARAVKGTVTEETPFEDSVPF